MKKTIKSFIILVGTLSMISCVMPSTDEIIETVNEIYPNTVISQDEQSSTHEDDSDNDITDEDNTTEDNEIKEDEITNNNSDLINNENTSTENESGSETDNIKDENSENTNNEIDETIEDNTVNDKEDNFITETPLDDNKTDESENNETIIEDETEKNNNGTLDYQFTENAMLCDFDYVIYYNNEIATWKFRNESKVTRSNITVNNKFNILVDITTSTKIVVNRGFGCPKDIVINDVKINDNIITIKISE